MKVSIASDLRDALRQALLSRATLLARRGNYGDAENVLRELANSGKDVPESLDLLARIRAQQGRFSEAKTLWRRALEVVPENETYRAGIRRVEKMQKLPFRIGVVVPLLALVAIASGIWFFGLRNANLANRLRVAFWHDGAKVVRDSGQNDGSTKTPKIRTSATLANIPINVSGVSVKNQDNLTIVQFDEGLFRFAARLKPEAKGTLLRLGLQLKPYDGKISVSVTGYTDNKPIPEGWLYRDDAALGMARSLAVVNHLRHKSGFLPSTFTMMSGRAAAAPYPNDTKENMLRNRTVIIRISPTAFGNVAP